MTPANVDDRAVVPDMTQGIVGRIFGDKGYISEKLFKQLHEHGLKLVAKIKRNMKNKLVELFDKEMLRHRGVIESVNDQLKNQYQIDHSRHRSITNFMVNLVAGLIAYAYDPYKPSVKWEPEPQPFFL